MQAMTAVDSSDVPESTSSSHRLGRAIEFAVLFLGLPLAIYVNWLQLWLFPMLWAATAVALIVLLRDPTFDRANLWRPGAAGHHWPGMAARVTLVAVASAAFIVTVRPDLLFGFPANAPYRWLAVMTLYPILSVYPQTIIARVLVFHRYRCVFGRGWGLVLASAAAFGFMHIVFHNPYAVPLSLLAGVALAYVYWKSRSALTSAIEHACYGDWVFTVGLGWYFFTGAIQG